MGKTHLTAPLSGLNKGSSQKLSTVQTPASVGSARRWTLATPFE